MTETSVDIREARPDLSLSALQTQQPASEALAPSAGSFFNQDRVPKRFLETPVDLSTGVPLPIFPSDSLPEIPASGSINIDRLGDWHHPFHPRSKLVSGDMGLQALRACRVQWVRYEEHHDGVGYHQTFAGPPIPENEDQLFKTIVFSTAGYVGNKAIKFAPNGQHEVVELGFLNRKELLKPKVLMIDDYDKVKNYLLDYAARKTLPSVSPQLVDILLHSTDLIRRQVVATLLIEAASEEITADIQDEFRNAKKRRWMQVRRSGSAAHYIRNLLTIQRDGGRFVDKQTIKQLTSSIQAQIC